MFLIKIFPISFSNAKMDIDIIGKLNDWTLFTYKNYLYYFPGRLKYAEFEKSTRRPFWVPMPKVVEVIP